MKQAVLLLNFFYEFCRGNSRDLLEISPCRGSFVSAVLKA